MNATARQRQRPRPRLDGCCDSSPRTQRLAIVAIPQAIEPSAVVESGLLAGREGCGIGWRRRRAGPGGAASPRIGWSLRSSSSWPRRWLNLNCWARRRKVLAAGPNEPARNDKPPAKGLGGGQLVIATSPGSCHFRGSSAKTIAQYDVFPPHLPTLCAASPRHSCAAAAVGADRPT